MPPIGPEPWSYQLLDLYSGFCVFLLVAQFVVVMVLVLRSIDTIETTAALAFLGGSFAVMVSGLLAISLLLIILDLARNVRRSRHLLASLVNEKQGQFNEATRR